MNRMQEWLARAAKGIGVSLIVGYVARRPDGTSCQTQALVPDLGGTLATIVLDSESQSDALIRRHLFEQGFSVSTFAEPLPNEEFDLDDYAEMFSEWGWAGDQTLKPEWMS